MNETGTEPNGDKSSVKSSNIYLNVCCRQLDSCNFKNTF